MYCLELGRDRQKAAGALASGRFGRTLTHDVDTFRHMQTPGDS